VVRVDSEQGSPVFVDVPGRETIVVNFS